MSNVNSMEKVQMNKTMKAIGAAVIGAMAIRRLRPLRKILGLFAILWSTITIVDLACGCCSSGVSYNEADKTLIVSKNNAILSWKNTVIGSEKDVDTILLKKGKDGLVRLTYFNILKDSLLTVSGEDFHFNLKGGVFSIYAKGGVSVLTNKYDNFTLDTLSFHDNCKRIVVEGFLTGRITYVAQRNDTNIHIIWLDIKSNDGRMVHVPVGICGSLHFLQAATCPCWDMWQPAESAGGVEGRIAEKLRLHYSG